MSYARLWVLTGDGAWPHESAHVVRACRVLSAALSARISNYLSDNLVTHKRLHKKYVSETQVAVK